MKTIILVRHGESETNVTKSFAGQLNIPLTQTGRKQASLMAEYMDKYHVDKLYASPLDRAADTAREIAQRQNCALELRDELKEMNSGLWQGLTYQEIAERFPEDYQIWMTDIANVAPEGGETCRQFFDRVISFFENVLTVPEETVCLVCHAVAIRMMESYIKAGCVEVAQEIEWVPNASVTVYQYDGKFHPVEWGTNSYLGQLQTVLPKSI